MFIKLCLLFPADADVKEGPAGGLEGQEQEEEEEEEEEEQEEQDAGRGGQRGVEAGKDAAAAGGWEPDEVLASGAAAAADGDAAPASLDHRPRPKPREPFDVPTTGAFWLHDGVGHYQ